MQEQNFEKQVREKMEELSFLPSEPVWKNVEEQIRKKKDRRRVLFWLLPVLLLTGGVVTWTNKDGFFSGQKLTVSKNKQQKVSEQTPQAIQTPSSIKNTPTEDKATTLLQTTNEETPINKASKGVEENLYEQPAMSTKGLAKPLANVQNKKAAGRAGKQKAVQAEETIVPGNTTAVPSDNGSNEVQQQVPPSTASATPADEPEQESSKPDTATTQSLDVTKEIIKDTAAVSDTSAFKIADSKKKKGLKWTVHLASGVSGVVSSAFKFLPVASSGVNSNGQALFDQSFNLNMSNGPANMIIQYKPEVYSDFSFSAGADVRKAISRRLDLTAGLNYSYYSTRVYIGSKVSAATTLNRVGEQVKVNDYFLATGVRNEAYKNQYHFVDLPVGVDWKIFKRLPLQLHSGITLSRMVATNALYYSNQQNIFYEDNRVFRKTQVSLFSDLSYRVLKIRSGAFYLGPEVRVGLSNLLKKGAYGNQHLFFAGLNTHFDF